MTCTYPSHDEVTIVFALATDEAIDAWFENHWHSEPELVPEEDYNHLISEAAFFDQIGETIF